MIKKILFKIVCYLMWFSWGLLDTIYGLIVLLFTFPLIKKVKYQSNLIVIKLGKNTQNYGWGFEAGIFVFSNTNAIFDEDNQFFCHEFGHCLPQTLVFGPLHMFICVIPSILRFWYRSIIKYFKPQKSLPLYDSFWVEGTATKWGLKWHKYLKDHKLID